MNLIYWVLSVHLIFGTPGGQLLVSAEPAQTEFETTAQCIDAGRPYLSDKNLPGVKVSCTSHARDCNSCTGTGNVLSCTALLCPTHQPETIEVTR